MVSGCFDVLHAGHIQFFTEARKLGDRLIVCFASDRSLRAHKTRSPSIPEAHKRIILQSLRVVDEVRVSNGDEIGLDFYEHFYCLRPDILAVTEDDQYSEKKSALCAKFGAQLVVLPKTPPVADAVSTSDIVRLIRAPKHAPMRVDFAGGWLDVPEFAVSGSYIVNCAVSPLVDLRSWQYHKQSGIGGSAAWSIINGHDAVGTELEMGAGWQDAAVINETGLCVWRSGPIPVLETKTAGEFMRGKMALLWTGKEHNTPSLAKRKRDYKAIAEAGSIARLAVRDSDSGKLAWACRLSYEVQMNEGMEPLPKAPNVSGFKYCGSGWGGYALYLFGKTADRDTFVSGEQNAISIEPYIAIFRM
jgi:cytidyltransferase-like protein